MRARSITQGRLAATACALAALTSVFFAGVAQAGVERIPLSGDPACEIDAPDGWTVSRPQPAITIISAAQNAVITLDVYDPDPSLSAAQLAAGVLADMHASAYSRWEAVMVGDRVGLAYYSATPATSGKGLVSVRVAVFRLGGGKTAVEVTIATPTMTPAQTQSLDQLAAAVRCSGTP